MMMLISLFLVTTMNLLLLLLHKTLLLILLRLKLNCNRRNRNNLRYLPLRFLSQIIVADVILLLQEMPLLVALSDRTRVSLLRHGRRTTCTVTNLPLK